MIPHPDFIIILAAVAAVALLLAMSRFAKNYIKVPPNAVATILWIDENVVEHAGRPAQRHVVGVLHTRIHISDRTPFLLGDEHERVLSMELRSEKRRIAALGIRRRRDESLATKPFWNVCR